MYTIGELSKKFKLSRSTILYYDKQGLLQPVRRTENNYRLYDENEAERLKRIVIYRQSGITIKEIKGLLDIRKTEAGEILIERLNNITAEIKALKQQEKLVLKLLRQRVISGDNMSFTSSTWTEMLIKLGYEELDWMKWHLEFEFDFPEEHHKFLKCLGMSHKDIEVFLQHLNSKNT